MMKMFATLAALLSLPAIAGGACMLSSESTSGMNKTCVYTCPSGSKSITISATSLCPLTI